MLHFGQRCNLWADSGKGIGGVIEPGGAGVNSAPHFQAQVNPMRRNTLKYAYLAGVVVLAAASAALSPYNIAALIPTPSPRPNRHMQPMLLPGLNPLRQAQRERDLRKVHYQLLR